MKLIFKVSVTLGKTSSHLYVCICTQNIQQEMFSFQQDVGILPIPFRARPHLFPGVLSILSWLWLMLPSLQASGRQLQWKVISEPRNLTDTSHTHTNYSGKNIKPKVVQTHKYLMAYKSLTLLFCSFVLTVLLSVAVNTTWETTKTFSEYYFPYFLSTAYKVRFKQWQATSLIDVKTGNWNYDTKHSFIILTLIWY